jgi:hypothetical protein
METKINKTADLKKYMQEYYRKSKMDVNVKIPKQPITEIERQQRKREYALTYYHKNKGEKFYACSICNKNILKDSYRKHVNSVKHLNNIDKTTQDEDKE